MSELTPVKKDRKKDQTSIFGVVKGKVEAEPPKTTKTVTVREEKKHLRRVIKPKPMSRKHMAESLEAPKISEKDLRITEQVLESVITAPTAPKDMTAKRSFACMQCGTQVPIGAERCPRCNVRYLTDIPDDAMDDIAEDDSELAAGFDEFLKQEGSPVIHFDAETGIMSVLESDDSEADFAFECSHCGTLVALDVDRCPICGTKLELGDTGIVGLFSDMEFDSSAESDFGCPFCGEVITPQKGRCPKCGELFVSDDPRDPTRKVKPVVIGENVVFMHLDVVTGELNYLQRLADKFNLEHMSVALEGIGSSSFDQDWKGISRI